jgi:putative tryptophan/tyrosine transport system substrate-binding protein
MRRRDFIALAGGAAAWPFAGLAQPTASVRRIGLLSPFSPIDTVLWNRAFLRGLSDLGWAEGKNVIIEYRYAEGMRDRLPGLVADLVRLKVDVIVTAVTADTLAAKNATKEIPIVMAAAGDPVATGIVRSLAQPGGNITGLSQMTPDLTGKRLELLKEIDPKISSVAVLFDPENPISILDLKETQLAGQKLRVEVIPLEVRSSRDLDKALDQAAGSGIGALTITAGPVFVENLKPIADFATRHLLPSCFHLREFAAAGGLLSYGVDRSDLFRRAAMYVDKILKGASPASLPIEQPTKFELVINLTTAKVLGLDVPLQLQQRADEVIE